MIITDNKFELADISVADVALTFPQSLKILNHYNLDYCCGGKQPFVKVCEKAGLNANAVWQEIQLTGLNPRGNTPTRFDTWSPTLLVDFIVQYHHQYVRESITNLQALLDKVCHAHGTDSPFLLTVRNEFNKLAAELLDHLSKEEEILFPAIRKFYANNSSERASASNQGQFKAPVILMEDEHEVAGHLIKSIRALTSNYTPPADACPTFKMAYIMLDEFDRDLMQHIHLENNVLFPKVTEQKKSST